MVRNIKTRHRRRQSWNVKSYLPWRGRHIDLHVSRVSICCQENSFRAWRYSRIECEHLWERQPHWDSFICWFTWWKFFNHKVSSDSGANYAREWPLQRFRILELHILDAIWVNWGSSSHARSQNHLIQYNMLHSVARTFVHGRFMDSIIIPPIIQK